MTALYYMKWLIDNFCPREIFDDIADRPDPSTAKVTMARIVAFDAFRSAIPHLDIILTPNGFGIVNNSNIAPASKKRVERLINSLLDNRDNEIEEQQAKCQTCLSISESCRNPAKRNRIVAFLVAEGNRVDFQRPRSLFRIHHVPEHRRHHTTTQGVVWQMGAVSHGS